MKYPHAKSSLRLLFAFGAGLTLSALPGAGAAQVATPARCDMELALQLTPDVPNPRDLGFLSSLLSNHPGYRVIFQGYDDDDDVLVELIGPGPRDLCRNVIRTMSRDGRILAVR